MTQVLLEACWSGVDILEVLEVTDMLFSPWGKRCVSFVLGVILLEHNDNLAKREKSIAGNPLLTHGASQPHKNGVPK